MKTSPERLPDIARMYKSMAARLGGTLTCAICGRTEACSESQAEIYLRGGWPRCCGRQMQGPTK
jgi:hypothetical protein